MFKIQNIAGGSLSLKLEHNCIILPKSAYYDLDGVCSRAWIHGDPDLLRLIKHRHVRVVHDSEAHIPKMSISKNEKVFNLLKQEEKQTVTLPNNAYSPKPAGTTPPALMLPDAAPHNRKVVFPAAPKHQSTFTTIPADDPIIIDLAKFIESPVAIKNPISVEQSALSSDPIISELPLVKIENDDLQELFKEFPEIKPKKRGRKKKVKVEDTDGSNQSD